MTEVAAEGAFLLAGIAAAVILSFAIRAHSPLLLLVIPAAAFAGALANVGIVLWFQRAPSSDAPRPASVPLRLAPGSRSGAAVGASK